MELYIENPENGRTVLNLVQNGPLVWHTIVEEVDTTRTKRYEELLIAEKLQADCDIKATNIVLQGDDPISFLNKAMAFLTAVASLRVTMQQVQGRKGQSYVGTRYKGNATSSRGNNARDEDQLVFLADLGIPDGQAAQRTIPNTAAFQTEDLDAYDSDCDDVSYAKAVLMTNLSNHGSDVISEELLVYVRDTCPTANKPSEKLVAITPMNKVKKVRRPKQIKTVGSSKKAKIVESKIANNSEPNQSWGSSASDVPSYSSLVNDSEDLGNLNAKADIEIFVSYTPVKKYFRIYNRRTRKIMETINVTFDELTATAFEQFSSGPGLQVMTLATSSSGLVPNLIPQQPFNPPTRNDWDHLFRTMFDECFNPPSSDVSLVPVAVTSRAVEIAASPSSTTIDQDTPSSSTSSTNRQQKFSIISQDVEKPITNAHFDDPCHDPLHEVSTSQESSLNAQSSHSSLELIGRCTKDHPLGNMIGNPSRPVSTRKQLETDAMWSYFDAFLNFVEPKNFKEAMLESSWIEAI
nr:integrase, catalytic region, zinc finger, CCHC-type, peptidase aspartic, catalytic [Tanacetum cinerariifolium]